MAVSKKIPFQQVIKALLDADTPLKPRYLYRLSDLESEEVLRLGEAWPRLPDWRRRSLMEDLETLSEDDDLLSFEDVARLGCQDTDPAVRLPAVRLLWGYENPSLIRQFLDLLASDPDMEVRAAAATGLGSYVFAGEMKTIPAQTHQELENRLLEANRSDPAPLVRQRALEALGYSSRPEVEGLIRTALASGNAAWMGSAMLAIGRSADTGWQPEVLAMLESTQSLLRAEAARAAGELELSQARPILLKFLDDDDEEIRIASIWSLSQLGGEGVRQALERLYEDTEDEEEMEYLEAALDNLAFSDEGTPFQMLDLADMDEDDLDEMDAGFSDDAGGEWDPEDGIESFE